MQWLRKRRGSIRGLCQSALMTRPFAGRRAQLPAGVADAQPRHASRASATIFTAFISIFPLRETSRGQQYQIAAPREIVATSTLALLHARQDRRRALRRDDDRRSFLGHGRLRARRRPYIRSRRRAERQADGKARAIAFLAVDLHPAAVQFDRHLYQVETDPGTDDSGNVAAAVIALEQM